MRAELPIDKRTNAGHAARVRGLENRRPCAACLDLPRWRRGQPTACRGQQSGGRCCRKSSCDRGNGHMVAWLLAKGEDWAGCASPRVARAATHAEPGSHIRAIHPCRDGIGFRLPQRRPCNEVRESRGQRCQTRIRRQDMMARCQSPLLASADEQTGLTALERRGLNSGVQSNVTAYARYVIVRSHQRHRTGRSSRTCHPRV